jgi:Lrp/AsnC family leucine-responsive transcriptional regulator
MPRSAPADGGLDAIDRKILEILQLEGRISNLKLAERVNLTPTPCLERVKRLERDGYITGYGARLDPARLGLGMLVFIEVTLDRTTPDVFDRFAAAVKLLPTVLECHMLAGGFDYLLKVRVADMTEYRSLLGDLLTAISGIAQTHTYVVMEEVKGLPLLPLGGNR